MLKSFIYLETGKIDFKKDKNKHNPFELKKELKKIEDYKLDKYDALLKRLFGHYQTRLD